MSAGRPAPASAAAAAAAVAGAGVGRGAALPGAPLHMRPAQLARSLAMGKPCRSSHAPLPRLRVRSVVRPEAVRRQSRLNASAWEGRAADRLWRLGSSDSGDGGGGGGSAPPVAQPGGVGRWLQMPRLPRVILPWDNR